MKTARVSVNNSEVIEARSRLHCIRSRDRLVLPFDAETISAPILQAGRATGDFGDQLARTLMLRVLVFAQVMFHTHIPTVEGVQNLIEEVLLASPLRTTANRPNPHPRGDRPSCNN